MLTEVNVEDENAVSDRKRWIMSNHNNISQNSVSGHDIDTNSLCESHNSQTSANDGMKTPLSSQMSMMSELSFSSLNTSPNTVVIDPRVQVSKSMTKAITKMFTKQEDLLLSLEGDLKEDDINKSSPSEDSIYTEMRRLDRVAAQIRDDMMKTGYDYPNHVPGLAIEEPTDERNRHFMNIVDMRAIKARRENGCGEVKCFGLSLPSLPGVKQCQEALDRKQGLQTIDEELWIS